MSGSFKGSTISWTRSTGDYDIVWSGVKPWKKYESGLSLNLSENNLRFGLLHLTQLDLAVTRSDKDIILERGVTDISFFTPGHERVSELAKAESDIISDLDVERILLVQKNKKFIESVILSDFYRSSVFPGGVSEYIQKQEDYIRFTKKHNNIDNVIEIECPEKYLHSIGQTLNNRY